MFDKLITSAPPKRNHRTSWLFCATGTLYAAGLIALSVLSIFSFNPTPVEAFRLETLLPPPAVPRAATAGAKGSRQPPSKSSHSLTRFLTPTQPVIRLPDPRSITFPTFIPEARNLISASGALPCATPCDQSGTIPGTARLDEAPPPVMRVTPKPVPVPTPAPRGKEKIVLTSQLLQGNAIRKVQPPYPAIARSIRAQGPVQIQVTISEDGQIIEAVVLSGHPALREVSLQAARQWLFRPTILNGLPVKVTGVITFNFKLE